MIKPTTGKNKTDRPKSSSRQTLCEARWIRDKNCKAMRKAFIVSPPADGQPAVSTPS